MSLGHGSIKATEIYLGVIQNLTDAPADRLRLKLKEYEAMKRKPTNHDIRALAEEGKQSDAHIQELRNSTAFGLYPQFVQDALIDLIPYIMPYREQANAIWHSVDVSDKEAIYRALQQRLAISVSFQISCDPPMPYLDTREEETTYLAKAKCDYTVEFPDGARVGVSANDGKITHRIAKWPEESQKSVAIAITRAITKSMPQQQRGGPKPAKKWAKYCTPWKDSGFNSKTLQSLRKVYLTNIRAKLEKRGLPEIEIRDALQGAKELFNRYMNRYKNRSQSL